MKAPPDLLDGLALCSLLMTRAVLTLRAIPDRDRPKQFGNGWPQMVRDARDAYGYTAAPAPRFHPTPHDHSMMLEALSWITWLEQNGGRREAQVIVARAFGIPWWQIAIRFGRTPKTIRRWHDGAVARVYSAFTAEVSLLASPARPDRPARSARSRPEA